MIEVRLCPARKMVTVRRVDGNHNHHFANDARTYKVNRKPNAEVFEEAVASLQYNTPAKVVEVCFQYFIRIVRVID